MTPIDDFIKNEESKMSWFDKLVMNYPKVRQTKDISRPFQNLQLDTKKVIRPSVWDKVICIIIFIFATFIWIGLLKLLLERKTWLSMNLIGLVFLPFPIFILIRNSFFNKKYIYNITIDKEGIAIDSNKFYWTDIQETCIMNKQERRRTNFYLVIFKKDKTIEEFDLYRIATTAKKLSTIIEYYKQKTNAQ